MLTDGVKELVVIIMWMLYFGPYDVSRTPLRSYIGVMPQGSPGNLQGFEHLMEGHALQGTAAIVALKMVREDSQRVMGISVVDTSMFTFGLCEFVDDDQFSTLEAVLVQLSAAECLIPADMDKYERQKLDEVPSLTVTLKFSPDRETIKCEIGSSLPTPI